MLSNGALVSFLLFNRFLTITQSASWSVTILIPSNSLTQLVRLSLLISCFTAHWYPIGAQVRRITIDCAPFLIPRPTFSLFASQLHLRPLMRTSGRSGFLKFATIVREYPTSSSVLRLIWGMRIRWLRNFNVRTRALWPVRRVKSLQGIWAPSSMWNARLWHRRGWRTYSTKWVASFPNSSNLLYKTLCLLLCHSLGYCHGTWTPDHKEEGFRVCCIINARLCDPPTPATLPFLPCCDYSIASFTRNTESEPSEYALLGHVFPLVSVSAWCWEGLSSFQHSPRQPSTPQPAQIYHDMLTYLLPHFTSPHLFVLSLHLDSLLSHND